MINSHVDDGTASTSSDCFSHGKPLVITPSVLHVKSELGTDEKRTAI